jgi:hypothetical protein
MRQRERVRRFEQIESVSATPRIASARSAGKQFSLDSAQK